MSLASAFLTDTTGRRYRRVLEDRRVDFREVLAVLEDPTSQQAMEWAELRWGKPALAGVVREVESLPSVERFLSTYMVGETARFRQAVGVAVRIVMESRGWSTSGEKGAVSGARWFRKAERYRPPAQGKRHAHSGQDAPLDRLRAARRAIGNLGAEHERRRTLELVMQGIAEGRAAEGRPF